MTKGLSRSIGRAAPLQGILRKQLVTVRDQVIAVSATGNAIGFGSGVISDFPQGNVLFLGAVGYMQFSGSGSDANLVDTWEGDFGVGTTPAGDATLTAADVDIIASTALAAATAEVGPRTRGTGVTQAIFDNTDDSLEINLSVLIDAADITDDQSVNLTVNGELELLYSMLLND